MGSLQSDEDSIRLITALPNLFMHYDYYQFQEIVRNDGQYKYAYETVKNLYFYIMDYLSGEMSDFGNKIFKEILKLISLNRKNQNVTPLNIIKEIIEISLLSTMQPFLNCSSDNAYLFLSNILSVLNVNAQISILAITKKIKITSWGQEGTNIPAGISKINEILSTDKNDMEKLKEILILAICKKNTIRFFKNADATSFYENIIFLLVFNPTINLTLSPNNNVGQDKRMKKFL